MPRNGSGTYNLPSPANPVLSGTTISSNWANPTMNDIAAEITNSLPRDGTAPMQAVFKIVDGAIGSPAIQFSSQTDAGIYRAGASDVRIPIGGSDIVQITPTGLNNTKIGSTTPQTATFTTLNTTGATSIGTTLAVIGNSTLGGTLSLTGAATMSSTLGVTGDATVGGKLTSTGNLVASAALSVAGNTSILGTLTQTGTATFNAGITAQNISAASLNTSGAIYSTGQISTAGLLYAGTTVQAVAGVYGATGNFSGAVTGTTFSGSAGSVNGQSFPYTNPSNSPTYVWSSNGSNNNFLAAPSAMSVNFANSCTTASNANQVNGISGFTYTNSGANPAYLWCTDGSGTYQHLTTPGALSVNYANSCGTASNSAALSGVGISYFVNNANSAVVNLFNAGSTFLESAISGYGNVIWSVNPSDARLKENIEVSNEDSLKLINQIEFKKFNYKKIKHTETGEDFHIDDGRKHHHGVLAQQLEGIKKEWVNDQGTYLQPSVEKLLFSALKAIQQLTARIEQLEGGQQ